LFGERKHCIKRFLDDVTYSNAKMSRFNAEKVSMYYVNFGQTIKLQCIFFLLKNYIYIYIYIYI